MPPCRISSEVPAVRSIAHSSPSGEAEAKRENSDAVTAVSKASEASVPFRETVPYRLFFPSADSIISGLALYMQQSTAAVINPSVNPIAK